MTRPHSDQGLPHPHVAAVICATGLAMVMFDNSAVIVALVSIRDDLGGSVADLQWVASVMALAAAGSLPFAGAAGDRYGARRAMQCGLALFGFGALSALLAPSIPLLLSARALQGAGAALMLPNGAALLGANVVSGAARNRAVGTWVTVSSVGLVLGPLVGGSVVQAFGWRWMFVAHLPTALLSVMAVSRLNDTQRRTPGNVDVTGVALAGTGLALLCLGFIEFGRAHHDVKLVAACLTSAIASFVVFVKVEGRASRPAIDLDAFRRPEYAAVLAAALLYNMTIAGGGFVISILFQESRGYSPTQTGLIVLLTTVGMPLGGQLTGRLAQKTGLRGVMASAIGLLACAYVAVAALALGDLTWLLVPLLLVGFCAGVLYSGDTLAVLASVAPEKSSSALATLSLTRQVGAVLGIAILGSLVGLFGELPEVSGERPTLLFAGLLVAPGLFWLRRHLRPES